ncbi:MAG: hypothetical protein ACLQNG_12900 [Acidimicrobiales bacterium]|jgi:hypothetical protein
MSDLLFGVSIDVDAELPTHLEQGVEQVLAGGAVAVQQVGTEAVDVITDDVADDASDRAAEGGAGRGGLVGQVDGTHPREELGRIGTRKAEEDTGVGDVDDRYEAAGSGVTTVRGRDGLQERGTPAGRREEEPLIGARSDHEAHPLPASGSEGASERCCRRRAELGPHPDLAEWGEIYEAEGRRRGDGGDFPAGVLPQRRPRAHRRAAERRRVGCDGFSHEGAPPRGRNERDAP